MSMSDPSTPSEDTYFNDLSRNPSHRSVRSVRSISPQDGSVRADGGEAGGSTRPKRIACIICRKRKLRCDGEKPSCGTCARLGHNCAYDEVRRKSGPKRGYVKELEARLGSYLPAWPHGRDRLLMCTASPGGDTAKVQNRYITTVIHQPAQPADVAAYLSTRCGKLG